MLRKPKKWRVRKGNPDLAMEISEKLGVSMITAAIIANRGIKNAREAGVYLNPSFFDIGSPFVLPDMGKAVGRVRQALKSGEKILIYGDRDVDGVTSVSLLYLSLKALGAAPEWFIPSNEGYGLHKEIIDRYAAAGIKLIITVDCGISNNEEISYAVSKGVEVIVTDHHEPPEALPVDAYAVVDPKRKDYKGQFTDFAGCAVALKFAQAILMSYDELYDKDLFIIDTETTGLHPQADEICEIAAVRLRNFKPVGAFQSLVRISKPMPDNVVAIHGITNEMCSAAPEPAEVIKKFLDFINGGVIVAHNAEFDLSFLRHYAKSYAGKTINNKVIDTLTISREYFPFRSHALGSLIKDLGFYDFQGHRAMKDVEATIKVFERLEQIRNKKIMHFIQENLDLITIGTIGDLMPLVSENRIMVKFGLSSLSKTKKEGIKLLIEKNAKQSRGGRMSSKDVSFGIVPVLNACGRRERADLAVKLLIEQERPAAETALREINQLNDERKELQAYNILRFREMMFEQCSLEKDRLLFVTAEGMEHGVTGIVASQIAREFSRPVLLLIKEGDEAVGAGRSIEGFNFHDAISECSDLLVKFGGHSGAIGLTVKKENIKALKERLLSIAGARITNEMLEPALEADAEIKISEINTKLLAEIQDMEPFGSDNPYPLFILRQVKVSDFSKMGDKGAHLRLRLSQNGSQIGAVGWRMGELADSVLSSSKYIDVLGQVEINRWQNRENLQLMIVDIEPVL